MPFRSIPKNPRAGRTSRLTVPTIGVLKAGQTLFRFPREVLRAAGLPDFPKARLDLFVGEGEDYGTVLLTAGERYLIGDGGGGQNPASVTLTVAGYGAEKFAAAPARILKSGKGELVLGAPAGFPLPAPAAQEPANIRPITNAAGAIPGVVGYAY